MSSGHHTDFRLDLDLDSAWVTAPWSGFAKVLPLLIWRCSLFGDLELIIPRNMIKAPVPVKGKQPQGMMMMMMPPSCFTMVMTITYYLTRMVLGDWMDLFINLTYSGIFFPSSRKPVPHRPEIAVTYRDQTVLVRICFNVTLDLLAASLTSFPLGSSSISSRPLFFINIAVMPYFLHLFIIVFMASHGISNAFL